MLLWGLRGGQGWNTSTALPLGWRWGTNGGGQWIQRMWVLDDSCGWDEKEGQRLVCREDCKIYLCTILYSWRSAISPFKINNIMYVSQGQTASKCFVASVSSWAWLMLQAPNMYTCVNIEHILFFGIIDTVLLLLFSMYWSLYVYLYSLVSARCKCILYPLHLRACLC